MKFDINLVVQQLGAKIGELETQLAFERSATEAYAKRVEELEKQIKDVE